MMVRRQMFAAGAAAFAGSVLGMMPARRPALAQLGRSYIPNIEVHDQHGRSHRFYDDLVRDRVVSINFFFTSCGEVCPLVTQNIREVQDLLGARVGRDIFLYSVSLQPGLETPEILKDYAQAWDTRPGWLFLTGDPPDIEHLRRSMGFASADPDDDRIKDNHTGLLRYGNDRLDRWAGVPGLARPAWIARAVSSLVVAT